MAYESMNLFDFQARFSSEEDCLQAVFDNRWPRGFICPYCEHNDGNRIPKRKTVQCCSCRR